MVAARSRIEDALARAGMYRLARRAYWRLFNRPYLAERAARRAFLARFVQPGSLVFDIGANHGELSETFVELGARVVAVEPNPGLVELIRRNVGGTVSIENVAVGAIEGVAELHLGRDDAHSTVSTEWIDQAPTSDRWKGKLEVPVTTVDRLIERHGRPRLLKIDVEGYEAEVLAGLHDCLPVVSFEFQARALPVARRCMETLAALGSYEFNFTEAEGMRLARDTWADGATLMRGLEAVAARDDRSYGDVYATLVEPVPQSAGATNQP